MKEPELRIGVLIILSDKCTSLLKYGSIRQTSSVRLNEANRLFGKITLHALSYTRLWPQKYEDLDPGALASIARNIIETHNVFQYICERGLSKEEFEFRRYLQHFHQAKSINKILIRLGFAETDNTFEVNSMVEKSGKEILENNNAFNSLEANVKKAILKGNIAYCWPLRKKHHAPIDKNLESGIYNFLSNSVHSFPLGLINYQKFVGSHHLNFVNLVFLSLEICIIYLASACMLYMSLWPKVKSIFPVEDKQYIKELMKGENIKEWLEYRKSFNN